MSLQEQEKMIMKSNTEMPAMQSPDNAPCLRISNNFWILSFDTIRSTNSEAAILFSKAKPTGVSVQPADNQVGRISSLVYHLCTIFITFIGISDNIVLGRLKCQGKLQLSCRATCRVSGVYGVADTP